MLLVEKNKNFKKYIKFFAKSAVSIFLIVFLVYFVDWERSFGLIAKARFLPVALAILLYPLSIALSSFKWSILLKGHNIFVPLAKLVKLYWVGAFVSNFLPSNIGGDFTRVGLLRSTGRLAEVAASVFVERLTGVVSLVFLSGISMLFNPFGESCSVCGTVLVLFTCGVFLCIAMLLGGDKFLGFFEKKIPFECHWLMPILGMIKKLSSSILFYRDVPSVIFMSIFLSFVFYSLAAVANYLFFTSIDVVVPFWKVFFVVPLINLISLIPASINSIGLFEGAAVLLYSSAGVSSEEALAVALMGRVLQILLSLMGGFFLIFEKRGS